MGALGSKEGSEGTKGSGAGAGGALFKMKGGGTRNGRR